MSSKWHLSREGKRHGPFSLDQIREMARNGTIRPEDLLRQEDVVTWVPASAVPGLFPNTAVTAHWDAPLAMRTHQDEDDADWPTRGRDWEDEEEDLALVRCPALWNPGAAAIWSLLFTPLFGAYLHARNWRVLDKPGRATANLVWAWLTVVFLAVNLALLFLHEAKGIDLAMRSAGVALLVGWYVSTGRSQIEFVKTELPGGYVKKSWGAPIGLGIAAWVLYLGTAVVMVLSMPLTAEELITEVRPLILEEWRKQPGVGAPSIQKITLTHKGGNLYTGFVDARFDNVPMRYELEVVVQGDSLTWQLIPIGQAPMK